MRTGRNIGLAIAAALVATTVSACSGGGGGGGSSNSRALFVDAPIPVTVAAGHDRMWQVVWADNQHLYGVGQEAVTSTADHSSFVVRFDRNGVIDPTFATPTGIARVNLAVGTSGELARGLVVQSTGKVVISATVEQIGGLAAERDVALARFNTDGTLDTSFGGSGTGIRIIDLAPSNITGGVTVTATDANYSINRYSNDDLLVVGTCASNISGTADTDHCSLRLSADGTTISPTFGTSGLLRFDIADSAATARFAVILPDQSALVGGYIITGGITSPIVYKITPAGQLDPTWGGGGDNNAPAGVYNDNLLPIVAETYKPMIQGDKIVCMGYGRDGAPPNDLLAWRLTSTGQLDTTFGTGGTTVIRPTPNGDNGRNGVVLPDGRIMIVGGGIVTTPPDSRNAFIAVLTPDGQPDETWGPDGLQEFDLGGFADFFWGCDLSPDGERIAVCGIKGSPVLNGPDDSVLMFIER